MRVKNREGEGQHEENTGEPAGKFHQHIGGLRAENVLRHAAAKRRAEPFALRALHQDHEHHDERDEHVNHEQNIDDNVHQRAGNMAEEMKTSNVRR